MSLYKVNIYIFQLCVTCYLQLSVHISAYTFLCLRKKLLHYFHWHCLMMLPLLQGLPLFTDNADKIVYRLCSKQDHSHDSLNKIKLQALMKKKIILEWNWKAAQKAAQRLDWVTGNAWNWYCQSSQLMKPQSQIIHELFWYIWRFFSILN